MIICAGPLTASLGLIVVDCRQVIAALSDDLVSTWWKVLSVLVLLAAMGPVRRRPSPSE